MVDKNVGISFEGRVIQKIMQITSRQSSRQTNRRLLSTNELLIKFQNVVWFDNQSASNWQLVVDHSATGRQTVGDKIVQTVGDRLRL